MSLSIEQLKNAFKKKSEGTGDGGNENAGFWDRFYPFFRMDFDQSVKFRFLPDLDTDNPLGFIVENKYHELNINGKKKRIACAKMYDEPCACCEMSKKYYDAGDSTMGKMFWRKIDYLAEGVIIGESPFPYPITDEENPVRMISVGPKLYKVIEAKIVNSDMDEMPYDMQNGYDFNIFKTKQGEYADYTTSDFARRSTAIPDNLRNRIKQYDLKSFRYTKIERDRMEMMIEAALTGKTLEEGNANPTAQATGNANLDTKLNESKPTQPITPTVVTPAQQSNAGSTEPNVPAPHPANPIGTVNPAEPAPAGAKLSPQEILAKLKARTAA